MLSTTIMNASDYKKDLKNEKSIRLCLIAVKINGQTRMCEVVATGTNKLLMSKDPDILKRVARELKINTKKKTKKDVFKITNIRFTAFLGQSSV